MLARGAEGGWWLAVSFELALFEVQDLPARGFGVLGQHLVWVHSNWVAHKREQRQVIEAVAIGERFIEVDAALGSHGFNGVTLGLAMQGVAN